MRTVKKAATNPKNADDTDRAELLDKNNEVEGR
jgi:hypothetical protein